MQGASTMGYLVGQRDRLKSKHSHGLVGISSFEQDGSGDKK
jgi:hypothetical protein